MTNLILSVQYLMFLTLGSNSGVRVVSLYLIGRGFKSYLPNHIAEWRSGYLGWLITSRSRVQIPSQQPYATCSLIGKVMSLDVNYVHWFWVRVPTRRLLPNLQKIVAILSLFFVCVIIILIGKCSHGLCKL